MYIIIAQDIGPRQEEITRHDMGIRTQAESLLMNRSTEI